MLKLLDHRRAVAVLLPALLATAALGPQPASAAPVSTRHLSDLTPVSARNGWGPVEADRSNGEARGGDGRALTAGGRTFARGLGVHAASELVYTVPRGCTRFWATVGVDDEVGAAGSVVFQVFTARGKAWDSGVRRGTSPNRVVSVPVRAGTTLRLVVTDAGDGNGFDHAAWGGARLVCRRGSTPPPRTGQAPATGQPPVVRQPSGPAPLVGTLPAPATPVGMSGSWNTIFADEFSGTALDSAKWSDHEPWETRGYGSGDAGWVRVPTPATNLAVNGGAVTLKQRREAGLPTGRTHSTAHIHTRQKWSIPAGVTSYTEARMKAPSNLGSLPAFWLLGNGTSGDGGGWPITGEVDILEFANNLNEQASPYFSVWYPKDVWTNAPGTFLNGTHDSHPDSYVKRPELKSDWHTWGLYRSPEKMELRIDGRLIATFKPNTAYRNGIALPPMLFTNPMHIRFSYGMGGAWAGAGLTPAQYQDGDFSIDYVKVWQAPAA